MRNMMLLLLGVSLLISGGQAQAAAEHPWVLYDTFNGTFIDPGKWLGKETSNDGGLMANAVREIKSNRLHLMMAAYGDNSTDTGEKFPSTRVIFRNATDITGIVVTIKIGKFEVQGCSVNPDVKNTARARISMPLFNVHPEERQEGSAVGDIIAQIRIQSRADYPETLKVYAKVQLCKDANCDIVDDLFNKELRTVNKDQSVVYSVDWDKNARLIKFTADKFNGKLVIAKYDYNGVYDGDYPLAGMAAAKSLHVGGVLANCTDEPWPRVNMEASFDNVRIKTSSVPGI